MSTLKCDKEITALLVIDPYNDFISEGGKLWDRLKAVAEANDCIPHMLQVMNAARKAELRVFYALHHRNCPDNYNERRRSITKAVIRSVEASLKRLKSDRIDLPVGSHGGWGHARR